MLCVDHLCQSKGTLFFAIYNTKENRTNLLCNKFIDFMKNKSSNACTKSLLMLLKHGI